ncbi:iron complex outermembrane receptor protein [Sinobacterium caligoides]|uniref:Iron complex outermembrane receptor protein n=1 Tax=Sinobacterium caligoides TaxID=933926 RepID=A0A3N2DG33_9GAMM|nr:TonB-dependent receptor [Sinobacterium caligoides]ROR98691.1 iron complex outermembrane receptor protein [Sinobacterium caligoides]
MKKILILGAVLSPSVALAGHDLPIEIVEVTGQRIEEPNNAEMTSQAPLTQPVQDAGALLRAVNGMEAARRGGRGFEPIIRGQSQNQINVISDGGYSFGSCPGRMDPPTTYVGFDNFDQVTVIKGNRSVIYGAGGSGGTILFEHQRPDFSEKSLLGSVVAGYTSNSDTKSLSANLAMGNDDAFVRVFGEHKTAGNYDDADGNTVSSAFDSDNAGIIAGADIGEQDYIEASFEKAKERDMYFAGNGMDTPYADSETMRLRWKHSGEILFLDSLEATLYRTDVDHLMDNYTLRDRNPMMGSGMAAPTSSETYGGKLLGNIETENSEIKLGMDYLANDRSARMFMDMGKDGSYDMIGAYLWPDVEQRQLGVFAEWDYQYSEDDLLRAGLRYDQFTMEATKANETVGMMGSATPQKLYQQFYGTSTNKVENNDVGFVLGWDRSLDDDKLFSVNVSRSIRNPDTNEAFIAKQSMGMNPSHWVGNPNIDSEVHQQIDLTLMSDDSERNWSATVFWDNVDDYIERYNVAENTLYRNVDATLKGVELEYGSELSDNLSANIAVSYTRGESDNGPLANIAPLTGRFKLDYRRDKWGVGSELIVADRQDKYNSDVDVDAESPGFAVMNLYSHWQAKKQLTVEAGVENLFDKNYAYHVNTASVDPFDPTAIRVNEPGRQYWLRVRYAI